MSHIIFKKDRIEQTLEDELSPLVRLKRVDGHLETPEGIPIDDNPVDSFDIVLAQLNEREYWINSCTWCYEHEQRVFESGADAYELRPFKDGGHFLQIPIRIYIVPITEKID